jgi:hypothetical protein
MTSAQGAGGTRGRVAYCCNWPPTKTTEDAVALLVTFGEIVRAHMLDESGASDLLAPRRRRPTEPRAMLAADEPSSGRVAMVEFEHATDATEAVASLDGAVFYGYELVMGIART